MEKYRNELKYLISEKEMILIRNRLQNIMKIDSHVKGDRYLIRSLYFDDYRDSCLYDVADGVDRRKKYRLRFYNDDTSRISLESKYKRNNMMLKKITRLDQSEAESLVEGRYLRNIDKDNELKKEFTYNMMSKGLQPKLIVEYERIPYVYRQGNVRITFDMNICSSADVKNYINGYGMRKSVLPDDLMILEVKYDEFLPSVIYDCIDIGNLQQLSFSKYSICRKNSILREELL